MAFALWSQDAKKLKCDTKEIDMNHMGSKLILLLF
jgi:hypothetical protein